MSVVDAVSRDVAVIARRDPGLADSAWAAVALAMAEQIDEFSNSATSKSMCAKAMMDALERMRELAPPEVANDRLDDLTGRRSRRLKAVSA